MVGLALNFIVGDEVIPLDAEKHMEISFKILYDTVLKLGISGEAKLKGQLVNNPCLHEKMSFKMMHVHVYGKASF